MNNELKAIIVKAYVITYLKWSLVVLRIMAHVPSTKLGSGAYSLSRVVGNSARHSLVSHLRHS